MTLIWSEIEVSELMAYEAGVNTDAKKSSNILSRLCFAVKVLSQFSNVQRYFASVLRLFWEAAVIEEEPTIRTVGNWHLGALAKAD